MILPFTTNQWNAIRFVALNLISIPLIELALHKLHQLGVADRMLRGRKARVRPSFLANWGLHQEVDELSMRSRITAIIVAFCYVGFSLYTEYASDSEQVQKKSEWEPPVMPRSLLNDKPALFDTTLMSVGPFHGCRSKKSRKKLQQLLKHMVNVKVRRYRRKKMTEIDLNMSFSAIFVDRVGEGSGHVHFVSNHSLGNSQHVAFSFRKGNRVYGVVAEMHDEEVCLRGTYNRKVVCFSNSGNITLGMVIGNIFLFDGLLPYFPSHRDYVTLPSASAFDFDCDLKIIGKSECERFALARTPSEYSNAMFKWRFLFFVEFKYDFGAADSTCNGTPRIEPLSFKVPKTAKLSTNSDPWGRKRYRSRLSTSYSIARYEISKAQIRRSFGIFHGNLIYFQEFNVSRLQCSFENGFGDVLMGFCAQRHDYDATTLSYVQLRIWGLETNSSAAQVSFNIYWTLNWTGQDLQLADLSRGALAYLIAARQFLGRRSPSPHSISDVLKRGIPKLTQVGSPGVKYNVIVGDPVERATVYVWVLGVWGVMLLIAVNYLLFVKLSKARLFPDVYLLYCHSVMRRHTRYNSGKCIRTVPTAAIASANGIASLDISYDDLSTGDIRVDDMLQ